MINGEAKQLQPEVEKFRPDPFARLRPPTDEEEQVKEPLKPEKPPKTVEEPKNIEPKKDNYEEELKNLDKEDEDEDEEESRKNDEDYDVFKNLTPRDKLVAILKDCKVPNKVFITKLFFAPGADRKGIKGMNLLNDLLIESDVPAKQRKKVLWLYFNENPENHGFKFADEDEKESDVLKHLQSNEELIEYPVRDAEGRFVKDANGNPITVKLTKAQLYWQMQEEKSMHTRSSNDGLENYIKLMMTQQDQNLKIILALMTDRVKQAESRANSDPFQTVDQVLQHVEKFGYSRQSAKDEIDRIKVQGEIFRDVGVSLAKEVSPEIRSIGKDLISTLKEVSTIDNDMQKTKQDTEPIPNIPKEQQETLFKIIGEKVNKYE